MQEVIVASRKAIVAVRAQSVMVFWNLLKLVVPIILLVKVATELHLIDFLAMPLGPVMVFVGLPPLLGLPLATGLVAGINSSLLLYMSLLPQLGVLSVADVSVYALIVLIAHGLPVEGRVSSYCGVSFWGHVLLRLLGAFCAALILRNIYTYTGFGAQPAELLWVSPASSFSNPLLAWGMQQLHSFVMMFIIIYILLMLMRILKTFDLIRFLNMPLSPLLRLLGISKSASTITVIGMLAGLVYGGGLIKAEVDQGNVGQQDVFSAMSFMALAHAMIEDTMLLMLIGADFNGIFWFRIAFAMVVTAFIVQLSKRVAIRRTKMA